MTVYIDESTICFSLIISASWSFSLRNEINTSLPTSFQVLKSVLGSLYTIQI